jgi:hypothetical protein
VSGALSENDYRAKLGAAGFQDIGVEVTRRYQVSELAESACCTDTLASLEPGALAAAEGKLVSAFMRARK